MRECSRCHHEKFQKAGYSWRAGKKVRRYRCMNCGKTYTEGVKQADVKEKDETRRSSAG